ncbi:hypothetical protein [Secundilactobacillus hailunensis]|uniref:hypothetical protein n=1 Tax=Secundilactobacillus hailunensis TaxID=2559923 RepID=UPI001A7E838D|nr:hypothetical protein [Secundilactobacillus hailunensis]
MIYYMTISASFEKTRKRKMRKNRKDQFEIMILEVEPDNPFAPKNLFHSKVRYVPSRIYESIPIRNVIEDERTWNVNETTVFRQTIFSINSREQADEIIEMFRQEYQSKAS